MWTAGFRFSWRKMETAAQDRAGVDGDEWSVAYAPLGATRHKSSQVTLASMAASAIGISIYTQRVIQVTELIH